MGATKGAADETARATTGARGADSGGIEAEVAAYYGAMGLVERIAEDLGRGFDGDLSPEGARLYGAFHIGGAEAVERMLDALPPLEGRAVLDIGCGVGGAVRALARRGARARGIDLTPEFVAAARSLGRVVGADPGTFAVGSALDLPYRDRAFDHAIMLHVGMNIADKPRLMAEAARVLRPGGAFAIYDILALGPGAPPDPLPWGAAGATSFPATAEAYLAAAEPWFTEAARIPRLAEGIAFLEDLAGAAPSRPLSEPMRAKLANLLGALREGALAPVELRLTRRG